MNVRDLKHELLPETSAEQRSRQKAVIALRRFLNREVRPGNVAAYEREGVPAFRAAQGRVPQSREEIEQALFLSPRYRLWSAANRAAQEMIWVSVGEPIYNDLERITAAARRLTSSADKKGTLRLNPTYRPSPEVADVDIHLQPGGYGLDRSADDIVAGALYEMGGNIFAFGQGSGRSDSKAEVVLRLLKTHYRDLTAPKTILDIGCSAGAASVAYAAHYRDAEVHAIDIGAGMLRYAHARAEALGVAVHFHQMDAAAMSFADNSFDLVVSHNLLHEIGSDKRRAMMAEAFRAAKPGGVVVHQDVAIRTPPNDLHRVERNWDTRFNGEVHWQSYINADLIADMCTAGFAAGSVTEYDLAQVDGRNRWYAIGARKRG